MVENPISQQDSLHPASYRSVGIPVAVLLGLAVVVLLGPLPKGWDAGWQQQLIDLAHIPLFLILTLALWVVLGGSWTWSLLIAVGMAGLAEVVQEWVGRSGGLLDFLRGLLGVALASVCLWAWQGWRSWRRVAGCCLVLLALLAWPIGESTPWFLDAYEGYRAFPTLADFRTRRQMLRWSCWQARIQRQVCDDAGRNVARVEFLPGQARYPGVVLRPIVRDWSGYQQLCCEFVIEEELRMVLSIRGTSTSGNESTHYQMEEEYAPGRHVVCIDLAIASVEARPVRLDLSDMHKIQLFIYRPNRTRAVEVHRVWLK